MGARETKSKSEQIRTKQVETQPTRRLTLTANEKKKRKEFSPYFDLNASGVYFVDAFGEQVGNLGARLGQMLAQIDAKGSHFARQPLVAALDRQTF